MFAATTADALSLSDPAILRKSPSSIPSCLDLIETPTASSWSPDNHFLYISSAYIVHRYEPTSNSLKDVYTYSRPISHLVAKDKHTVVFVSEDKVHILECDPNPRILQTFDSHKTPVTSLSLSNDSTLLSSTSAGAIHIHNLSLGSHTVMRGLPTQDVTTAAFHSHSRTRLLVAAGKHLMVYDTTRLSGPLKSVAMSDSASGDITCVACSPFSKTLVVAATSTGFVGLIDLDKEKALFRTLNLKTPLTTLGFSPEGAAIYLGTNTGKLLVLDLRSLDKPAKSITLSDNGSCVETISVQRKAKAAEAPSRTPMGATARKTSEVPPVPRRTAVAQTSKSASKPGPSPARPHARVPSGAKEGGPTTTPKRPAGRDLKKVLSPIRDPLGNSASGRNIAGQLDDLADRRRGKTTTPKKPPTINKPSPSRVNPALMKADAENPRRARTLPTSASTSALSNRKSSSASITTSTSAGDRLGVPNSGTSPVRRPRAVSSSSRATSEAISAVSSKSAKYATATATSSSSSSSSASRPASSLTSRFTRDVSSSPTRSSKRSAARTPSPDLPDMHLDPVTPVPAHKQKKGMNVLGLGTPEVDRWIQAGKENEWQRKSRGANGKGKGKGKMVGFQDEGDEDEHRIDDEDEDEDEDEEIIKERELNLSMQISPRRPIPGVSASGSGSSDSWAPQPNPLTGISPAPISGGSGVGASGPAQELLKTIVQDVMYDFQRETKAEMMGLHLDLLRMGRGWKTELRTLMDEYVGDLRELREENQRLRVENERLRRGY